MSYSGSILNPQATQPAAALAPRSRPQPVFSPPQNPAPAPVPQANFAPTHAQTSHSPRSPPIKQAAPQPWIPTDGSGKTKDLPCGDSTAHRGTSTYYSAAPLDPGKVPVCNNCHVNIRWATSLNPIECGSLINELYQAFAQGQNDHTSKEYASEAITSNVMMLTCYHTRNGNKSSHICSTIYINLWKRRMPG